MIRLRNPLNIGGTFKIGRLRFVCRLWWFGWTQEMSERVWRGMLSAKQVKQMDNKELLHHLISIFHRMNVHTLSTDDFILSEVEDRLFPEYDGETVTWENWGWHTPVGDIVYHPELNEEDKP